MDISRGYHLLKDGDSWVAVGPDFVDLVLSPAGFGANQEEGVRRCAPNCASVGGLTALPVLGL
jgi:hypothetical protein